MTLYSEQTVDALELALYCTRDLYLVPSAKLTARQDETGQLLCSITHGALYVEDAEHFDVHCVDTVSLAAWLQEAYHRAKLLKAAQGDIESFVYVCEELSQLPNDADESPELVPTLPGRPDIAAAEAEIDRLVPTALVVGDSVDTELSDAPAFGG